MALLLIILALLLFIAFAGLAIFVAKLFLIGVLIVLVASLLGGMSLRGRA